MYFNRTESIPDHRPGRRSKQVPRPREEWIPITVPSIVDEVTFGTVDQVTRDNSRWSPRRAEPGRWMQVFEASPPPPPRVVQFDVAERRTQTG